MLSMGLLFALIIGISVAWTWSSAFDTHGPWKSFFWFFLVIFLFSWGAGSWITPFGPTGWGVPWMPILFMGIFMALLLTATTPRMARRRVNSSRRADDVAQGRKPTKFETTFDAFFWTLILVMVGFAFSNYIWHFRPY